MKRTIISIYSLLIVILCFGQTPKREIRQQSRQVEQEIKEQKREARRQMRSFRQENRDLEGQIQISGAFALYPLVVRWSEEFRRLYPNVRIDISAGGAGKGITDALTGMVDIGMVSREIHEAEVNKGAYSIAVAKDAVVATINTHNPLIHEILYRGLSFKAALGLWRDNNITTWGGVLGSNSNIPVHVYTRSDACGAAETWASWMGLRQEDLEGTAVFGDPGVASVVQRDKVAIGFNNLAYAYDTKTRMPYRGIMVMPVDLNDNGRVDIEENFYSTADDLVEAISQGIYPTPPARMLYLVTNGKPVKREVLLFLEFALTQGQQYALESLFVPLSAQVQDEQLKLID